MNAILLDIKSILKDFYLAWFALASRGYLFSRDFFKSMSIFQVVYLCACLAMMLTAAPHWIAYQVTFTETRSITLGSEFRMYFFLAGLLGLFLNLFKIKFNRELFWGLAVLSAILWLSGFIFPEFIHSKFKLNSDYEFNFIWVYLYGLFLSIAIAASLQSFQVYLLTPEKIKNYIMDIPK